MGANPNANGGLLLKDLRLPDFRKYAVEVPKPGTVIAEATRVLGDVLRDALTLNAEKQNFRIFGPDETASNRLNAVFEVTDRTSTAIIVPNDDHVSPNGRVMEVLSEHMCQGWLEGYLLTGRHGFFSCYEAFIHIVDSMFNQHAKWLKTTRTIPWRRPIASLNYLLTSHVWRQDHNGFSHQDPGFIDHVVNKKADVVRVYLPPDANCLLSVADHCLRSRNYVNLIIAGKQPALQWMDMDAAIRHCTAGMGIWDWASTDAGGEPEVVMACCGDVPTLETLAAVDLLRQRIPDLKIRVVNVVDLMTLQPCTEHPHGLSDRDFDAIFTTDKPIVFAFHGYPWLIHRLTYRRTNHNNLHVRGYKEEGTTTTPFDMTVLNDLDRFHLAGDVIDRVPRLKGIAGPEKQMLRNRLIEHKLYISRYGDDMPAIRDWRWAGGMKILVLNGGSSSFKCWFADLPDEALPANPPQPLWTARVDWSRHSGRAQMQIQRSDGSTINRSVDAAAPVAVLQPVLELLWSGDASVIHSRSEIDAVGHRIVHGGPEYRESAVLTAEVRAAIAKQVEFAPSHNRFELEAIRAVDAVIGTGVLQVASFDTGFHSTLSPAAYIYPGPYQWFEQGVRRYGFHGNSHRYAARRAVEMVGASLPRLITCHLGNGASLAAIRDGKSIDTTMGFTPLEGVMMGTRSGSIDPGILIYLIRHRG